MVKPVYTPLSLRDWVMAAPTPAGQRLTRPTGLSAPGIRSQTSSDRLRELYVSEVFTVIPEACEAAAVKLVGVVVK